MSLPQTKFKQTSQNNMNNSGKIQYNLTNNNFQNSDPRKLKIIVFTIAAC